MKPSRLAETTSTILCGRPLAVTVAIFLVLFLGSLTASATTYISAWGQNRTHSIQPTVGTHTFVVDGIFGQEVWTEWYVNGVYAGESENDHTWSVNGYADPSFTRSVSTSTTQIRALCYNGSWQLLQTHTWNITFDTTAPTVPSLTAPSNGTITTDNTVSLDWSDSSDSGTGVSNYEVQVDDSSGFGSPNYSATPASSSQTTSALADGLYYWRVRAKDNANNWSSYSSSRTFRVDTTAPSTPSLSSPGNGSSTSDQTPTFDWADSTDSGGSGVSYYEVEIYDGDITWGDISTTATSSTYTPSSNIPLDTIYWRIRAVDNVGNKSAWSAEWSLNIVDTTAPTVPSLSSPSDGSATSDNTVSLDWSDSSDANGISNYEVQVDDSSGFGSPNYSATPGSSSQTTSALADGFYYWRVRAKDNANNWSSWSSSRTFRVDTTAPSVPTLSSPANSSSTGDQTPTFDWSDSTESGSGLNRYEIEVYDGDITWGDISATTTLSTFTPGSNIPFDRIYWRVRAVDNVGNASAWSTEFWFDLVDNVAPSVPALVSPADGSRTASSSVALDWNDSTDAGTGVSNYEVQVDDLSSFASPNYSGTPSSSSATTSTLADGVYYWRVRAKDNANNWSGWSSSRTFRVDTFAPTVPTLLAPANGSSTGDQTPIFDWTDASDVGSGLSHYEVEIYDGDITWGDISTTATASTFTPGSNIPFDRIYWKIRAVDNVGNKSAWSTEFWFDLVNNAPTQPGTITPSNVTSNSASIAWVASTDSDGDTTTYEVEYGVNNTPGWTSAGTTTSTSRSLTSLQPETTYVVRVRATDGKGGVSSWRELDPAFTTLPVRGIIAAYWIPPLQVAEGAPVVMRAEVVGFTPGDVFSFDIYEDDFPANAKVTTSPLTGTVYASNGKLFVEAMWTAQWEDDFSGDPEYFFKVFRGGIEQSSSGAFDAELHVRQRRFWSVSQSIQSFTLNAGTPSAAVNIPVTTLPAGVKLAQVAFHWKATGGTLPQGQDVYLDFFGPAGWNMPRKAKIALDGTSHVISFQRGDFDPNLVASAGGWGIRLADASGIANVQFEHLYVSLVYYTAFQSHSLTVAPNKRKLVVFVHGWNPQGKAVEEHYHQGWDDLQSELATAMAQRSGWAVAKYDWASDASTGELNALNVIGNLNELDQVLCNPIESMYGRIAHGFELGREIETKCPSLVKVQFIAHSAGNWAARGAAKYLKERFPGLQVQVTSLDPFIPTLNGSSLDITSAQNQFLDTEVWPDAAVFAEMDIFTSFRDAYYTWDDRTDYLPPLIQTPDAFYFTGKRLEQAGWDIGRLLNSSAFTGAPDAPYFAATITKYGSSEANSHSGPVYWYSETTKACNDGSGSSLNGLGFASSILYTEPSARIDSITPSTAQPPTDSFTFQGSATVNGGSVAAWEWSSSVDGNLSTNANFAKSSRELTVGPHVISFRIRDSQGNWSDSVSANITVNNALPTAMMSGIPGTPVLAGGVLNLTLSGEDNDENGQSVAAGELSVSGSVIATPLGSYNFSVPSQAGDYTISYRVRDDEGSWSSPVSQTLTVQSVPDTTPPTVTISNPSNGQGFTSSAISINGTASDPGNPSSGISLVEVRHNGGAWQTAIGTTGWSAPVTLASNSNTLEARSRDVAGLYSSIASVTVNFTPPPDNAPTLNSSRQGNNLVLSWPTNATGFGLYWATNLPTSNWTLNASPTSTANGQYVVTNSMTNPAQFFRLKKP